MKTSDPIGPQTKKGNKIISPSATPGESGRVVLMLSCCSKENYGNQLSRAPLVHRDMHGGKTRNHRYGQFRTNAGAIQPNSEIHANTFSLEQALPQQPQALEK
jgi:hypothetical protein